MTKSASIARNIRFKGRISSLLWAGDRHDSARAGGLLGFGRSVRRKGMTLIEIVVVLAIMVTLGALAYGALDALFLLEQRAAARELALTYERLREEAVLRNLSFRVTFHLDRQMWQVEVGRANEVTFKDHEAREEAEERWFRDREELTKEESEALRGSGFKSVQEGWAIEHELPDNTVFGGVYTPQYEEMITPDDADDFEEKKIPFQVSSHVFANGFTEHTVVILRDRDNPESGYTVEVEPLSGQVTLHNEIIDIEDSFDWVPDEGPSLAN